ncbi:putative cation-transporting ATPase F [Jannaschia seosinensis]|uniref:Putative cation-transporting ATPase F n=1 Tax=Jannaschia seosinensis TaxID=313367 RepID=A0A0M7B9Y5_9RHOB|nr:HAD-IC family P-type ATPase [Jannaschia seosinensis]CUH37907.1 putative cation-transporting ATPase F [Jannaschia seosinensis]
MTDIKRGWSEPVEAVLDGLDTRRKGLTHEEVRHRRETHGTNSLPEAPRPSPLVRFARQFNNLLILVLIAAAGITAVLGHWIDTFVILAVVVINAVIGFVQEGRAESALAALRDMLAPNAAVLRDGERQTVPAADLVPGDIVLLDAGDKVPADLRLIETAGMTIEEAILTGESVPVQKGTEPVEPDAALGDRASMAFSGTMVSEGSATGVVTATGGETEIGRISGLVAGVETLTTPLIRQIGEFAKYLTSAILLLSAALLAFTTLVRGMAFDESFMIVVGLFVAAIPEGLPAVLTVTLAIGVQAMANRNAIIRRLPAIETIGSVSVICTDKTGTLTRNEMVVETVVTADGEHRITGDGYAPEGRVMREDAEVEAGPVLAGVGLVSGLCNGAALRTGADHDDEEDGEEAAASEGWHVEGDPMEGALLALAGKLGQPWRDRPSARDTIPFDARYRYMAVLHDTEDGQLILLKGAPEAVLERCDSQMTPEGARPIDRNWWQEQAERVASNGQRVLALARKEHAGDRLSHEDVEDGLTLLGLAGLIDPPRAEAIDAVAECHAAGIRVKMITGDHKGTAAAIGRQIGIENTDAVLTGADIDKFEDEALRDAAEATGVFARTSPEHKLRLVTALQSRGATVAMTGDGVNDAPALKRADAGIAMGQKGSQAAREASDLVLADDNFASIAAAVREGRTVYDNILKVITWTLPTNGGESLTIILAVLLGVALPVTPLQILWINMITAVALGLTLAFEPTEERAMERPPRPAAQKLLAGRLLWRVLFVSVLMVSGIFTIYGWAIGRGLPEEVARTIVVNTLVVMEIFYLFSVRYTHGTAFTWQGIVGTRAVLIGVGITILAQVAFTYLPFANLVFGSRPLGLIEGLAIIGAGVSLLILVEGEKYLAHKWVGASS